MSAWLVRCGSVCGVVLVSLFVVFFLFFGSKISTQTILHAQTTNRSRERAACSVACSLSQKKSAPSLYMGANLMLRVVSW